MTAQKWVVGAFWRWRLLLPNTSDQLVKHHNLCLDYQTLLRQILNRCVAIVIECCIFMSRKEERGNHARAGVVRVGVNRYLEPVRRRFVGHHYPRLQGTFLRCTFQYSYPP